MPIQGEQFTDEEEKLLAPYVTNTSGSVFALTHLPEVIKGALFSRYSRSELGLRKLLLKEFIQNTESEFTAIGGTGEDARKAEESHLAVKRAQNFYDRILDGYGDDSIGELGGAHLAIENVSMIATKVLEDARIGGSPLEKSTRYVSFAEKVNGDYLFYKEPTLMASPFAESYLAINRKLFETYADLIEPLSNYIKEVAPKPPEVKDGAYNRSVKARALDGLRGLLPASTLTNMGIFGNGRFFEMLLLRCRTHGLKEMKNLGADMAQELNKIVPSFVRRADPENKHFQGFKDFEDQQKEILSQINVESTQTNETPDDPWGKVELIDHDPMAETRLLAALVYPGQNLPLKQLRSWAEGLSPTEKNEIFAKLGTNRGNRRHKLPRALENVSYTFDLKGDFGMYRDMHRHRLMTQSRQNLGTDLGYVIPPEITDSGLDKTFKAAMEQAAEIHQKIVGDFPHEAQYTVPMAYKIRWYTTLNLRELAWVTELRSSEQGHPAYRWMAQQMFLQTQKIQPNLAQMIPFVDLNDYPLGRLGAEQRAETKQQK